MIGPFYYAVQLAKGSVFSGVKVWFSNPTDPLTGQLLEERPALWRCQLNGEDVPIHEVIVEYDGVTGLPVVKGKVIPEKEYEFLARDRQWAKHYASADDPAANPRQAVDMNKMSPIKFK